MACSRDESWWLKVLFLVIAGVSMLLFETTQRARVRAMEPGADTPVAFKATGDHVAHLLGHGPVLGPDAAIPGQRVLAGHS